MAEEAYAVGVDLGGTKVQVALIDRTGHLLDQFSFSSQVELGAIDLSRRLCEAIQTLIDRTQKRPCAIGVGLAGQIDGAEGMVIFAPNLQWRKVPLRYRLQEAFGLPTAILNDVRAATWGEWLFGTGQGCQDFICLFIGTGIGGGIVSGGRLLTGVSNSAGEVGHTTLVSGGRLCSCGHRGCWEAYASGWGLALTLRERVAQGGTGAELLLEKVNGQLEQLNGLHLAAALAEGNELAKQLFDELALYLADGCISLVNSFNPSRLLFGGGIIDGFSGLLEAINLRLKSESLPSAAQAVELVKASLGSRAPLVGAAAAAFAQVSLTSIDVH